jgi:hypothetical protein
MEKKRLSRAFIKWGGFYQHAPEAHDSSAPADTVNEAKEAMEKAVLVCKERLYKLGDLSFAPKDPTLEKDILDSETSLEEPAEVSSENLAASCSEHLQDGVDASKALENENTLTTSQGQDPSQVSSTEGKSPTQDSVSNIGASKAPTQETAFSPQIEESPPTYSRQPAKPDDLRSKFMKWFRG